MAKKGQQQLQQELNSDEDLENFLMKSGLCLLDIYSDWCGPCLGLVSALRKFKLEVAGDQLNLAIARAEGIYQFSRFIGKSEPTWMFIVNQKAVNIAFGSEQPYIMKILATEMGLIDKPRKTYALNEMQGIEIERYKAAQDAKEREEARIAEEKAENRAKYLKYVTETIAENLPDCAITIYGPQTSKDVVKKIIDAAESMGIKNKDRKYTTISKEDFEVINFACTNPLPEDVQEIFGEQEVLVCYWKLPEAGFKALHDYINVVTKPRTETNDEGETLKKKPYLTSEVVKIEFLLGSSESFEEPPEPEPDPDDIEIPPPPPPEEAANEDEMAGAGEEEGGEEEEEDAEPPPLLDEPPILDMDMDLDLGGGDGGEEGEEEEDEALPRIGYKYVRLPALWTPANPKGHAALIYTLFHAQTAPFLPPDPVPDPPHIIMAFDSWRAKKLHDFVEKNPDNIFFSGYFTSDDVGEAQFIARSPEMYELSTKSPDDKYIIRVNKVTSHTMLNLASYQPTYVSPTVEVGKEDAKYFFPETYITPSQEELKVAEENKKLGKTAKGKKGEETEEEEDDEHRASETSAGEGEDAAEELQEAGEQLEGEAAEEQAEPPPEQHDEQEGDHQADETAAHDEGAPGEHADEDEHHEGAEGQEDEAAEGAPPEEHKPEEPKPEEAAA